LKHDPVRNAKHTKYLGYYMKHDPVRNAKHTKYLGYYMKHDLVSCAALRKGVFAAAAAMMLINL
jgi:hypothetical protein